MARNVSIFALPIYWLVVMGTRFYSPIFIKQATKAGNTTSNTTSDPQTTKPTDSTSSTTTPEFNLATNANPHSTATYTQIQTTLSPAAYQRWERIQAAHRNGWENMTFFFAAVILGNFARLNALELSLCAWLFVAARIVYVVLYIVVESEKASYGRSAAFGVGVVLCWWLLLRAAVFVLWGYHELH